MAVDVAETTSLQSRGKFFERVPGNGIFLRFLLAREAVLTELV